MEKPAIAIRLKTETASAHDHLEKHPNIIALGEGHWRDIPMFYVVFTHFGHWSKMLPITARM